MRFFLPIAVLLFSFASAGEVSALEESEIPDTPELALAVGAAAGALVERALRDEGFAPPPSETPAPAPTVAPIPGPVRGNCPKGQYELAPDVCIGLRKPTDQRHPKDLEFSLCVKFRDTTICMPGFFDCKTSEEGVTTCQLQIVSPLLIPDVKCDFEPAPDGGARFSCTFPDPSSPRDRKTLPGRITFPGDGEICIQVKEYGLECFKLDDLRRYPFLPDMIPLLPGYPSAPDPIIEPAKQSGSGLMTW